MNAAKIKRLEKLLERELSEKEITRLRRIKDVLEIDDHDAFWDILTAMEYQRFFYEELPAKIAAASADIFAGLSAVAEKEVAHAQSRLAENMAEQARKLSVRINLMSLLPMGLTALVCLLFYGSLLLWSGFCIGSGRAQPPEFLLRMPSGLLMGGLFLAGGVFCGACAAKEFSEGKTGWQKRMIAALAMAIPGGIVLSFAL
jgi:hypothetical protein